ncbi:hypothetical protein GJ496_011932 [Pomphorhynchus laevis]|nr:hypothetical protein GJ496_011932 [Pomphorhynchus laevis]
MDHYNHQDGEALKVVHVSRCRLRRSAIRESMGFLSMMNSDRPDLITIATPPLPSPSVEPEYRSYVINGRADSSQLMNMHQGSNILLDNTRLFIYLLMCVRVILADRFE